MIPEHTARVMDMAYDAATKPPAHHDFEPVETPSSTVAGGRAGIDMIDATVIEYIECQCHGTELSQNGDEPCPECCSPRK